ncbi:MAG: ATP-binding protein [Campylobacterota bacterium]|nr:ATP-binding protein [Campylobacterota bacterium]
MANTNYFIKKYISDKFNKIVLIAVVMTIITILYISKVLADNEIKNIENRQYNSLVKSIHKEIDILIDNKKETTSFIAMALSNDINLKEALNNKNNKSIKLQEFSDKLNRSTNFRNVWFQIIDKDGYSFYRSWTNRCGDCMLEVRSEIEKLIKNPKKLSTISVGKFDMTFKSMVPIYDKNTFIGIFEIITHFDSIASQIKKENLDVIFLADKSYKKQIIKPYSKLFIEDYYVALKNPNERVLNLLKTNGIENYIHKDNYFLDKKEGLFITTYYISDIDGKDMGYAIVFKPIKSIKMDTVNYITQNIISIMIIFILIIAILGYYLINKNHKINLVKQHKLHEKEIEKSIKFFTIGQMAAGITHEINTPLTYIKGTIEMSKYDIYDLEQSAIKQRLLDDNKQVMDGINRMSIIIESMKEMSQVAPTIKEESNIYATLITVLRMTYNRSKQITKIYINDELFVLETSSSNKYTFNTMINKQKIEQVWTIIINNALDELMKIDNYEKRKIDISIKDIDGNILISFQDNAGGIDENLKNNIFEPFVSNKTSSGIGIGLNVAKKILDEHKATIDVENKNDGACFSIRLN